MLPCRLSATELSGDLKEEIALDITHLIVFVAMLTIFTRPNEFYRPKMV